MVHTSEEYSLNTTERQKKRKEGKPVSIEKKRSRGFLLGRFPSCHKRVYFTTITVKHTFTKAFTVHVNLMFSSRMAFLTDTAFTIAGADRYLTLLALYAYLPSDY